MTSPKCCWLIAAMATVLAGTSPALAAGEVVLTPQEVEAIERKLVEGKPNIATVAIVSFVFPGAAQAQMGHVDHTLALWGSYVAVYTGAKALIPDATLSAGQRVSDWIVLGAFLTMAGVSAVDAYALAQGRRAGTDAVLNRLLERRLPVVPGTAAPMGAPTR